MNLPFIITLSAHAEGPYLDRWPYHAHLGGGKCVSELVLKIPKIQPVFFPFFAAHRVSDSSTNPRKKKTHDSSGECA